MTYKMVRQMTVLSTEQTRSPGVPVAWIKTEREAVKTGCSGDLTPVKHDLTCKTYKCSDAGVITTHDAPSIETALLVTRTSK